MQTSEVWFLKLNHPATTQGLLLRFALLTSANGFKHVAETWALVSFRDGRDGKSETAKTALKQTHDSAALSRIGVDGIRIGECELRENYTKGVIQSKGRTIKWDLSFETVQKGQFNLVPDLFRRMKLTKNSMTTLNEDLRFAGTLEVEGKTFKWNNAPGMRAHRSGPYMGHSWMWGHCNAFSDENGRPASLVFEGFSGRSRMTGFLPSPKFSTFYFMYQGNEYHFNTVMDSLHSRSEGGLSEWKFQAERGDLSFRGHIKAEYRDFTGLTFEDTDGGLFYSANSNLSDMTISIYRRGKLESTFKADGTAALEIVTRQKNPYVPLVV